MIQDRTSISEEMGVRDAKEVHMITGQDIHEGYNRVIAADAQRNGHHVIISLWEVLTPKEKALYNNIAAELNKKVEREQEARDA